MITATKHTSTDITLLLRSLLPGTENVYIDKLAHIFENKKSTAQIKEDISALTSQLNATATGSGTVVAKILLDEITLPAALQQIRIQHNLASIAQLGQSLRLSSYAIQQLSAVYGSLSSQLRFDTELKQTLEKIDTPQLSQQQKVQKAVDILLEKASGRIIDAEKTTKLNQQAILKAADTYHLSFHLTTDLLNAYTKPGTIPFQLEFDSQLKHLLSKSNDSSFCASLVARIMLCELTPKDAQNILLLRRLLNRDILEKDLLTLSYRYLRKKSPQEIASVFETVLHRLPHLADPSENLGLAVDVLLEGTQEGLERACSTATTRREKNLLYNHLIQDPLFHGYEDILAEQFGGKKEFSQLRKEFQEILQQLPYCQTLSENKELACKVIIGKLTLQQAITQAKYLCDVRNSSLTKGISPDILKCYKGEKSATDLIHFFKTALMPYTFWRTNSELHLFALRTLVGELNGTYNSRISQFILNQLEKGASIQRMEQLMHTLKTKRKYTSKEVEKILYQFEEKKEK